MNERRSHGRGALATAVACTLVALGPAAGAARAAPFQPLLAPTVAFDFSPAHPRVGDNVTFTSTSTDVGATITSEDWDFNHDGATDASGHVAHHIFIAAGSFIVTLTVTNDATPTPESNSAPRTVTVAANQPPVASFTFTPGAPLVGATVTFKSTSTDSDGTIVSQAWDLDNDGQFNDGTGLTATTAFTTPGPHVVRLEARPARRIDIQIRRDVHAPRTGGVHDHAHGVHQDAPAGPVRDLEMKDFHRHAGTLTDSDCFAHRLHDFLPLAANVAGIDAA